MPHSLLLVTLLASAGLFALFVAVDFRYGVMASHEVASAMPTAAPPVASVRPLPAAIDPDFSAQVEGCLIPVAALYGFDLRITSGFRTLAEQDRIFRQGRTENGHIVTEVPAGMSLHNYGLAVDLVDRLRGYDVDWDRLGRIAAYCGIKQNDEGDLPHFEYRDGLSIEQLAAGERPRRPNLPCPLLSDLGIIGWMLTPSDLQACGAPEL